MAGGYLGCGGRKAKGRRGVWTARYEQPSGLEFQPSFVQVDGEGRDVKELVAAPAVTRHRMESPTITAFKWLASGSGIVAAAMVSLDLGRRLTGWGFVVFVASSICWITGAAMTRDLALGTQNVVLFGINLLGVYRYLVRKKPVH